MEMIIMKKEYNQPQITIVQVSSVLLDNASFDGNRNYGDGEGITIGSRRSGWDDWEDGE
jgi:hypothetical protein